MRIDTTPLIILCANTPYDDNPLGAKPLAQQLSKNATVVYVDPPLSYVTALKQPALRASLKGKRLQLVSNNLYKYTPVVLPGKDRAIINRTTSFLLRKKIARIVKKLSRTQKHSTTAVIATAPHYRVFDHATKNHIYWMMDDYASEPGLTGIDEDILLRGQEWLMYHADHIVVVSESLAASLKKKGVDSVVVHNGVDIDSFQKDESMRADQARAIWPHLPESFALFVGRISARVDLSYLENLEGRNIDLVIAGGIDNLCDESTLTRYQQLITRKNVVALDSIAHQEIPMLMYGADVGLVPYAVGAFNNASMPLKIPEYLSTGLQVVSTHLDFVDAFNPDDVTSAKNPQEFADAVAEILNQPPTRGQRAMRASRIAQDWSWNQKSKELLALLK